MGQACHAPTSIGGMLELLNLTPGLARAIMMNGVIEALHIYDDNR